MNSNWIFNQLNFDSQRIAFNFCYQLFLWLGSNPEFQTKNRMSKAEHHCLRGYRTLPIHPHLLFQFRIEISANNVTEASGIKNMFPVKHQASIMKSESFWMDTETKKKLSRSKIEPIRQNTWYALRSLSTTPGATELSEKELSTSHVPRHMQIKKQRLNNVTLI